MHYSGTNIEVEVGDYVKISEKHEEWLSGCVADIGYIDSTRRSAYCEPRINPPNPEWVPIEHLRILRKPYKIHEEVFWCDSGVVWSGRVLEVHDKAASYSVQYDEAPKIITKVNHNSLAHSTRGILERDSRHQ